MSLRIDSTPIAAAPPLDLSAAADARRARGPLAFGRAFLADGPAADAARQLVTGEALCVTTGQQPGLFTGPLYTVYKALTAIRLARACATALGRPVVPVFWVAGDDHDFRESSHTAVIGPDHAVRDVRLRERPDAAAQLPLYREPLGPEVGQALEQLLEGLPPTEFRDDVVAWITRHYRPDRDLAGAFAGALAELLGPAGLVVLQPTHDDAKRAMAPLLVQALEKAEGIEHALVARASALEAAGHAVLVPVGDGATLVMIEGRAGRDRLRRTGDGFVSRRSGETWSMEELRHVAAHDPARLSPNVLLRPAVEAALLPTLAYVGGPGELAYFPQIAPVYEALGVAPQTPVPRWSARLVEPRVAKVLEKFGIAVDRLSAPEGQLEAELVREHIPDDATAALHELRRTIDREFERLREATSSVDPTLAKPVQQAQHQALSGLAGIEKRLVQHLKKQNDIAVQQVAKARASMFPAGSPQERVLNIVPFLVRFGPGLIQDLLEASATAVPPLGHGTTGA